MYRLIFCSIDKRINNMKNIYLYILILSYAIFSSTLLLGQAPTWSINSSGFQHSMSLTAQVKVDGTFRNSGANILAAFVNGELRGVATPMNLAGEQFYFLSIYSKVSSGETIDFKIWLEDEDIMATAIETVAFIRNSLQGNYPNGFELNVSTVGDFPIQVQPIPGFTTLAGIPFEQVKLENYLSTQDNDPVSWTSNSSTNLTALVDGNNMLIVTPNDPNWTGTENIVVKATEQGTANNYSSERTISFTVLSNYADPQLSYVPTQFADDTHVFYNMNLNSYLTSESAALEYRAELIPPSGNEAAPNWSPPTSSSSMTIAVQLLFNGQPFEENTKLAGFVSGVLTGIAIPKMVNNTIIHFLTLANVANGKIEFRVYDEVRNFLYTISSDINYVPNQTVGTALNPYLLELTPITLTIDNMGTWTVTENMDNWTGEQKANIIIIDRDYSTKRTTQQLTFTKNQCPIQEIEICPDEFACLEANTSLSDVVWFKDGFPVAQGVEYGALSPGEYHYEATDNLNCLSVGCMVVVKAATNCPSNTYPTTSPLNSNLNLPQACTDGINLQNDIVQNPCTILIPVELLSFKGTATEENIELAWITASEINNEGFEIQASQNAKDWKSIGFVKGNGTTVEQQKYNFTDGQPFLGTNYYRLKQIDTDGTFDYSQIIAVDFKHYPKPNQLVLFPNPTSGHFQIISPQSNAQSIQLYNMQGQMVKEVVGAAMNDQIDITELVGGIYLLRAQVDEQILFGKIALK